MQTSLLDQCHPQWHLQDPDEAEKAFLLYEYLQERKRWDPINYFLYGVFDHGWYEFLLKYWWLYLVSIKFRCQILLQGISGGTNTVIYHVLTHEKSTQKSYLIQFYVLPCNSNGFRPYKRFLRNKFLRKKEIIIKTWTLHKRKVHIKKKRRAYEF